MDSANEASPLLIRFAPSSKKKFLQKIPTQITITGIVLGLFIIVMTLTILFEDTEPILEKGFSIKEGLLGSQFKHKDNVSKKVWKDKNKSSSDKTTVESTSHKHHEVSTEVTNWSKVDTTTATYWDKSDKKSTDVTKWKKADKSWKKYKRTENGDSTTENSFTSSLDILGSFKFDKKGFGKIWKDKKYVTKSDKNFHSIKWCNVDKGWKMIPNKENSMPSEEMDDVDEDYLKNVQYSAEKQPSENINLLGSPFKYNKKAIDKEWQDKKDSAKAGYNFVIKNWDKVDKGWKVFATGSPFKYNKRVSEKAWQDEEDSAIADNFVIKKWDKVDKGWKISITGQPWSDDMEDIYKSFKDNLLKSSMNSNNMKWKTVDNGWKKLSNKKYQSGNPFNNAGNGPAFAAPVPLSRTDCELIAETERKKLGQCIDLSFLPKQCKPVWRMKCYTTYKYRKIDGTCNNKIHPTWGKSGTPFVRMVAPSYGDGYSSIRTSVNGGELPNARLLSQKLYSTKMKPDIDATLLFMSFGLFIDHDMVQTATDPNGPPCCDQKLNIFLQNRRTECIQINVPDDDPFYGPKNVKCLNLVRSIPVQGECIGRREQLNEATSFLDGSNIYGSKISQTKNLRSFKRGQLRTVSINGDPYMAYSEREGYKCGTPSEPLKCFKAGDPRVNMAVQFTVIHTLWYREHNRIAEELHKLNPKWTDEKLFQEARRILIAELQHITYKEFLPLLLGEETLENFQLKIMDEVYELYDDTIDPSAFNVFGTAASRFVHSLAQGMLDLVGPNNVTEGRIPLHQTYFNLQLLYHNGLDLLLRGSSLQRTHAVDSYVTTEVKEHLFQQSDQDYGQDLAAIGIQRGRDHGLPSYTKWRTVCDLSPVNTWDDLLKTMDAERADRLKEVYQSVDDIDLIPGALAENPVDGSLLGPTFLCIIGRQFKKTRAGDRFWFEIQNEIGSLAKDQLNEIFKSNIARIVCDNSDGIEKIQMYPFTVPSAENPIVNCDEIPKVDLSKWIGEM